MQAWYIGLLYVTVAVLVGVTGVLLVRRFISPEILKPNNDTAGPIYGTIGVAYSILLAFVVTLVWGQFNDADKAIATEANQVIAIHRDISTFATPLKIDINAKLRSYVASIVEVEWHHMEERRIHGFSNPAYDQLWRAVNTVTPETMGEQLRLQTIIKAMNRIDDSRSERFLYAANGVPVAIWVLLVAGGLITVLFPCFLGTDRKGFHILMISTLAAMLAFTLFLITAIDQPFAGVVQVDQDAYENALIQLEE